METTKIIWTNEDNMCDCPTTRLKDIEGTKMEAMKVIWTNEDNMCDCYLDVDGGRCIGTKETDLCDCLGLKENCSFYPAKRRQAQFKRMTEKPANPAVTFICPNCDIHLTTTIQVIEGDEETAWLLFKPAYCPNCGRRVWGTKH